MSSSSAEDSLLSSKLYHEYILTLNTLKSHLDHINTLTKLNLQLDRDHASNIKNIVSTLNEMIDRVPALGGMQKIEFKESPAWNDISADLVANDGKNTQQRATAHPIFPPQRSSHTTTGANTFESTSANSGPQTTTLDERILQLRRNPDALRHFFDDLCAAVDDESQSVEIEPYQFSRESFRLLVEHLVEHVLIREDKLVSGAHVLALVQVNGMNSMFKAVPNALRQRLVDTICDHQEWISQKCDAETIHLLQDLYTTLKQL